MKLNIRKQRLNHQVFSQLMMINNFYHIDRKYHHILRDYIRYGTKNQIIMSIKNSEIQLFLIKRWNWTYRNKDKIIKYWLNKNSVIQKLIIIKIVKFICLNNKVYELSLFVRRTIRFICLKFAILNFLKKIIVKFYCSK